MSERIDTLGRRFADAREANDKAQAAAKQTKQDKDAVEQDLWDYMDDQGLTTLTLDLGPGYGKIQLQKRETIRGIVTDPAAAEKAIKEMGLDDALLGEPKVRQAPLSENMRDWLASGQQIPDGLDFTATRYVSLTRK